MHHIPTSPWSALRDSDDVDCARTLLRDCLEDAAGESGSTTLEAHAWRQMANIARRDSDPEGALKALSRAVDAIDREQAPLEAVEAKEAMAALLAEYDRPDFGAAYPRQARDISRKLGST